MSNAYNVMNYELLKDFIDEEYDEQFVNCVTKEIFNKSLVDSIEIGFNRHNLTIDPNKREVIIDDELNPDYGECHVPFDEFLDILSHWSPGSASN